MNVTIIVAAEHSPSRDYSKRAGGRLKSCCGSAITETDANFGSNTRVGELLENPIGWERPANFECHNSEREPSSEKGTGQPANVGHGQG